MSQVYQKQVAFRQPQIEESFPTTVEQIVELIGRIQDKFKVLEAVLPCAMAMSQAEVGALLAINNDAKTMAVVVRQGMPDEVIEQLTKGALGHLLLIGQWVRVEPKPQQLNPEQALLGQHDLTYLLGIPLQFDRQVLGAIVVGIRNSDHLREKECQQQLATLAHVVGLFLDNIHIRSTTAIEVGQEPEEPVEKEADDLEDLLEAVMSAEAEVVNQNNDLGLLNALSDEVGSTLQLSEVLELAVKQTRHALNSEIGWCYLFDNGVLTLREHQGLSQKYVEGMQHLKPGDGSEGMAFSRNEPILRDGLLFHQGEARRLVQEEGLCTVAAMPLTHDGEPFGVLALADRHNREWSRRDERMLLSISRQVARAIINSQMFSQANEKMHDWEVNYYQLQQANEELVTKVSVLEKQVQALRQAEQRVWSILAASSQARYEGSDQSNGVDSNKQLIETLRKALGKLNEDKNIPLFRIV